MRVPIRVITAAIAFGAICWGGSARAQHGSPQFYGYPSAQVVPSGQANTICYPPPACQPTKYGCNVTVCECPCSTGDYCAKIKQLIPPIRPLPNCQVNVCEIEDEEAPRKNPETVTIYRNCYVPIKIRKVPAPTNVTPIDINVKWREIHVLCNENGVALNADETNAALQQFAAQAAAGAPAPQPGYAAVAAPTPTAPAAAQQPTSPVPAVAAAAPVKNWVWLASQNLYGFGYQRADGLWVIDPGSKRPTLPDGMTSVDQAKSNLTMAAASN